MFNNSIQYVQSIWAKANLEAKIGSATRVVLGMNESVEEEGTEHELEVRSGEY